MPFTEPYTISDRLFWWFRFWGSVLTVAAALVSGGYFAVNWAITRASLADVAAHRIEISTQMVNAEQQTDRRFRRAEGILGNVRDNLLILMDRQQARPKPLPAALVGEVDELTPEDVGK